MASQSGVASSGPFTFQVPVATAGVEKEYPVMCPTCPSVPAVTCTGPSKAHLPTSATPFGSGPQVRYPASYPPAATWRGSHIARGFLSPFGHRHLLLGHPVPAGNSALLTVGLPGNTRTLTGFPRSARTRFDRGGCPLYPGTVVLSRPVDILQPAPAAFSSGQSYTPLNHPI